MVSTIAGRIEEARRAIDVAAVRSGRDAGEVVLLVAAKSRSLAELSEAYDAGIRDFGENRADELARHAEALPDDIRWHFIGTVQRRKIPLIRPRVVLLHSLDRARLADAWASGDHAPPVLIEVNIGEEPQKHGVHPSQAAHLVEHAAGLGLEVQGLMTVPPQVASPELARPFFMEMAALADSIRLRFPSVRTLSMGMTDDFEVAVEEGAIGAADGSHARSPEGSRTSSPA